MEFVDNLKKVREREGITKAHMAKVLGIDDSTYWHYGNEDCILPSKYLVKLCDYYHVSIDFIFGLTTKRSYENSTPGVDKIKSGRRIKEFRREHNLTQVDLAKVLSASSTAISGYETGRYLIATPFLYDICRKYKVSADWILGRIDYPKYIKNEYKY